MINTAYKNSLFDFNRLSGKKIVFEGDSVTYGYLLADTGNRFSSLVCSAVGATEVNVSVAGKALVNEQLCATPLINFQQIPIFTSSHGLYWIALGTNDVLQNNGTYNASNYRTILQKVVNQLKINGWKMGNVMIVSPWYMSNHILTVVNVGYCGSVAADFNRLLAYRDSALKVAKNNGTLFFDPLVLFNDGNAGTYLTDGVHPNIAGHALIKDYLLSNKFATQ